MIKRNKEKSNKSYQIPSLRKTLYWQLVNHSLDTSLWVIRGILLKWDHTVCNGASLVAQTVKNLPAMHETQVWSHGQEDPLEEGMATHSSILVWRIPKDRGACQATVHGVAKSQTLSN